MKHIKELVIFTGKDAFPISLKDYDEVQDETMEFGDHIEVMVGFYKDGKLVRRIWNPSCDIIYKPEEPKP